MELRRPNRRWQDWAVFTIRLVTLGVFLLAYYTINTRLNPLNDYSPMIFAAAVVIAANLALLPFMFIKRAAGLSPYVIMLGDWAITAALVHVGGGQPLLLISSVGVVSAVGLLRLSWMLGLAQTTGVLIVTLVVLLVAQPDYLNDFTLHAPELIVTLMIVIAMTIWTYLRDDQVHQDNRKATRVSADYEHKLNELRDSQRTVSELAMRLGSTLNYDKVLDAALDIGGLFRSTDGRVVSIVFLHRAGTEMLYVANSRGLTQYDEMTEIPGKRGIIGRALTDAVAVVGGAVSDDPELREFNGLQAMQSMMCIPLRADYNNYGVLLFASIRQNAFHDDRIDTLTALSNQVTLALQNAVLYRNLREEKERIIEMEENARKALVRDLHDIPTQTISAVTMRVRVIQRSLQKGRAEDLISDLDAVEEMAQRATDEIRHVLFKLRPLALESQGLAAALQQLAEKTQKTYKQNVVVRVQQDIDRYLDHQTQGMLFYLIEEAVSNARKYAQASQINVSIGRKDGLLAVRVADNGVGFDLEAVNQNYNERGSFGMVNMRERAEMINGRLHIESVPGRGTTITVLIPFGAQDTNRTSSSVKLNGHSVPNSKLADAAVGRVARGARR
jgi:signal transduction histidine kinase